jgi:hypothetical protein
MLGKRLARKVTGNMEHAKTARPWGARPAFNACRRGDEPNSGGILPRKSQIALGPAGTHLWVLLDLLVFLPHLREDFLQST